MSVPNGIRATVQSGACFCAPISLRVSGHCSHAVERRARRSRVAVSCRLAAGRGGSLEGVETIDELVVSLWRRVTGNRGPEPLSAPVRSIGISDGKMRYLLSTTIIAKEGQEQEISSLLSSLQDTADAHEGVVSRAVNQDPDDPCMFLVLEHFSNQESMARFQQLEEYQTFVRDVQPLLEKPMGVYLCKEMDGKISHGYYPFGPGGEGGRDDMVFR